MGLGAQLPGALSIPVHFVITPGEIQQLKGCYEHCDRIGSLLPLAFLAVPVLHGSSLALSAPLAWVPPTLYVAALLFALSPLRRRARGDVPRAVITLIARMSLPDAVVLAGGAQAMPATLAIVGFVLTLALQRWVVRT